MKQQPDILTLINKSIHRKEKAAAETARSLEALRNGKVDEAIRRRNRAVRLRGWSKRYETAADRWIIDNCH